VALSFVAAFCGFLREMARIDNGEVGAPQPAHLRPRGAGSIRAESAEKQRRGIRLPRRLRGLRVDGW
jgi:hypothetical protein